MIRVRVRVRQRHRYPFTLYHFLWKLNEHFLLPRDSFLRVLLRIIKPVPLGQLSGIKCSLLLLFDILLNLQMILMDLSFVSYNRPLPRLKVNCLKHLLRNSFANINDILDSDLTLLFKDQTLQLLVRLTELNVDVRLNFLKVVLHITLQLDDMVLHFLYLQLQRIQIVFNRGLMFSTAF